MRPKQYTLAVPEQESGTVKAFAPILQNALLSALLEHQFLSLWQYEQCCGKLRLPAATDAATIRNQSGHAGSGAI